MHTKISKNLLRANIAKQKFNMATNTVTKCVCHKRSFEELKDYAEQHNLSTVQELQDRNMCSCGCQMCLPYVQQMLKTGQTAFAPGEHYGRGKRN